MANKSKSNPEKGLRNVSIEFAGKTRIIEFTHSIVGDFEADANAILRLMGVVNPGNMIFADRLMDVWIGTSKVLSCVLFHGLKKDDPELKLITIDESIDAFIQKGGDKQELMHNIELAYRYATNPSTVVSLQRNWQISREQVKFFSNAEIERMDLMEKAIAEAKAKSTPGGQAIEEQSSNLDSPQTS